MILKDVTPGRPNPNPGNSMMNQTLNGVNTSQKFGGSVGANKKAPIVQTATGGMTITG
jgi:hypothetical protein